METFKGSILVIDDNEINRKYVKTVLRNLGRRIYLAESGKEGLDLAFKHEVGLILIDIQMPEMDGFECLDLMKKDLGLKIPILAITAYSDSKERSKFISYGFSDYISKPVKPEALKSTVEYWLNESSDPTISENLDLSDDFSLSTIEELKRYATRQELIELYLEFIEETNHSNEKLLFLQTSKDYTEILSILHVIKGNAGSLGFSKLSKLAEVLERDLKLKKVDSLPERIQEIEQYTDKIFKNFDKQLNLNL